MDDKEYFQNITTILKNSTHPEVYHFRNGNHPGSNWYLKTVCPMPNLSQLDKYGYGLLWNSVAYDHPESVKLVAHAYDWEGKEIPYMASVWLDTECDVILSFGELCGYNVLLVDRNIGNEFYVKNLREIISITRGQECELDQLANRLTELDEMEAIADELEKDARAEGAIQIRKEFKVLDGGREEDE